LKGAFRLQTGPHPSYSFGVVIEIEIQQTEATVLARAFDTERGDLPEEVARVLLEAKLAKADRRRMEELGELAQQGGLTPAQRREAEAYDRIGVIDSHRT